MGLYVATKSQHGGVYVAISRAPLLDRLQKVLYFQIFSRASRSRPIYKRNALAHVNKYIYNNNLSRDYSAFTASRRRLIRGILSPCLARLHGSQNIFSKILYHCTPQHG